MSEIDINNIILWNSFKEKLMAKIDNSDPFQVDLAFEYRGSTGNIYTFSSNDDIYVSDILIDRDGYLIFCVPVGTSNKWFCLNDADCISNYLGTLAEIAHGSFSEASKEVRPEDAIPINIKGFLKWLGDSNKTDFKKLIEILNNSSEHIKKQLQLEKDKKSFEGIEDFGIF